MSEPRVLIAGAGIAGLTLASALRLIGAEVVVAERRERFDPVASGIFITGNGLAMLERIGALDAAMARGFPSRDDLMEVYDDAGTHITTVTYPRVGGPHIPATVGMRRSHLQDVLETRARELDVEMRLGTTVTELHDVPGRGTQVIFPDGCVDVFDLVVGADGIRSQVRGHLFVAREPRPSGFGVWRVVCPRPPDLDIKIMMISDGPRLGIMPISDDELYLFGVSREPADARYAPTTWRDGMLRRFGRFQRFAPELFAQGGAWHFTQVEEVDAEHPWSRGTTVLIGDAAHATTPFLAQGASMAMEDAVVLAEMVAATEPPAFPRMLEDFRARRLPRVAFVQHRSAAMGNEWEGWGEAEGLGSATADDLPATMQRAVDDVSEVLATPV